MKKYVFYYCTSYSDYVSLNFETFMIKAPRFCQAFRQFKDFLRSHPSDYISYGVSYHVVSVTQGSHRLLSEAQLIQLAYIKDKHNLYSEVENDEIY